MHMLSKSLSISLIPFKDFIISNLDNNCFFTLSSIPSVKFITYFTLNTYDSIAAYQQLVWILADICIDEIVHVFPRRCAHNHRCLLRRYFDLKKLKLFLPFQFQQFHVTLVGHFLQYSSKPASDYMGKEVFQLYQRRFSRVNEVDADDRRYVIGRSEMRLENGRSRLLPTIVLHQILASYHMRSVQRPKNILCC